MARAGKNYRPPGIIIFCCVLGGGEIGRREGEEEQYLPSKMCKCDKKTNCQLAYKPIGKWSSPLFLLSKCGGRRSERCAGSEWWHHRLHPKRWRAIEFCCGKMRTEAMCLSSYRKRGSSVAIKLKKCRPIPQNP